MNNKVTIIGVGSVGATIAYTLVAGSSVSEIVLIDVNSQKALSEALDIKQATPFLSPANVYEGDYSDAAGSDIVIITSGVARKPGQTRIDLAQTNVNIIKQIAPEIVKYAPDAIYLMVANPVDILTYVFEKYSGLPKGRVIGSGTILDTIRLRTRLSELYSINQKQVQSSRLKKNIMPRHWKIIQEKFYWLGLTRRTRRFFVCGMVGGEYRGRSSERIRRRDGGYESASHHALFERRRGRLREEIGRQDHRW